MSQDMLDQARNPEMALVFYWSYVLITFFVLLNALLAIIVESYDRFALPSFGVTFDLSIERNAMQRTQLPLIHSMR